MLAAKKTGMRLIHEDDGIAMPLSLLVFLFLSFLSMSVFAIGEVARSRTELQYKADHAAHAAALVQADAISRIAVLNRAMVWTYAQVNRMQMDYIMNRWLNETKTAFTNDADSCQAKCSVTPCTEHQRPSGQRDFAGHTESYNYRSDDRFYGLSCDYAMVRASIAALTNTTLKLAGAIHGFMDESDPKKTGKELKAALDGIPGEGSWQELEPKVETGRANLKIMQEEISAIKKNLPERLLSAVKQFGAEDVSTTFKLLFGDEELKSGGTLPDYFGKFTDEKQLYERYNTLAGDGYKIETASWRGKGWWQSAAEGIGHSYSGSFKLRWHGYYVTWVCKEDKNIHVPVVFRLREKPTTCEPGINPNPGGESWPEWWNQPVSIEPCKLKESFFGKSGALVVGVKKAVPNLFAGTNFTGNFWNRFKVDWDMWCVAAARAGLRIPESSEGEYENSKFEREDKWNLFLDDWDAVFLPVGRCWKKWNGQKFEGESAEAGDVLAAVRTVLEIPQGRTITGNEEEINKDMLH